MARPTFALSFSDNKSNLIFVVLVPFVVKTASSFYTANLQQHEVIFGDFQVFRVYRLASLNIYHASILRQFQQGPVYLQLGAFISFKIGQYNKHFTRSAKR